MIECILEWIQGRSFVVTENGNIGPAPAATNSKRPHLPIARYKSFLLAASRGRGEFGIAREFYVHGIMYGGYGSLQQLKEFDHITLA